MTKFRIEFILEFDAPVILPGDEGYTLERIISNIKRIENVIDVIPSEDIEEFD